jgi:hypothetical protein
MKNPLDRLTSAINAELKAEQTADRAERHRRQAWWNTTWALAEVPRADSRKAIERYVEMTGQSARYAEQRRHTGAKFTKVLLGQNFPLGRLAMQAYNVKTATVEDLLHAEREGMSLREFNAYLTGKRWSDEKPADAKEAIKDAVKAFGADAVAEAASAEPEVRSKVVDDFVQDFDEKQHVPSDDSLDDPFSTWMTGASKAGSWLRSVNDKVEMFLADDNYRDEARSRMLSLLDECERTTDAIKHAYGMIFDETQVPS